MASMLKRLGLGGREPKSSVGSAATSSGAGVLCETAKKPYDELVALSEDLRMKCLSTWLSGKSETELEAFELASGKRSLGEKVTTAITDALIGDGDRTSVAEGERLALYSQLKQCVDALACHTIATAPQGNAAAQKILAKSIDGSAILLHTLNSDKSTSVAPESLTSCLCTCNKEACVVGKVSTMISGTGSSSERPASGSIKIGNLSPEERRAYNRVSNGLMGAYDHIDAGLRAEIWLLGEGGSDENVEARREIIRSAYEASKNTALQAAKSS